ncbi:MAG TPA: hypothetical protein PLZ51_01530 [Aggregatilineales bacterium]|nr:hypothetical protein [Aggregatilineales bacterium]
MRYLIIVLLIIIVGIPIQAQEPEPTDEVNFFDIFYDSPVRGQITDSTYFDFWRFSASAGDEIIVRMKGEEGLAPLIGIAGSNREVIVRSDMDENGEQLPDATPDSTVELRFIVPIDGEFAIVATRAGRENGTTSGYYTLALNLANSADMLRDQARQAVEFRCGEDIVTTTLNIQLPNPTQPTSYRITVYGLDSFEPAVRIFAGVEDEYEYCTTDGQNTVGDTITFWDVPMITIDENTTQTAQYGFNSSGGVGQITFTIASVGGGRGRYVAVLEGLTLAEIGKLNPLDLQMGAIALGSSVTLYMVKAPDTRIDPFMAQTLYDGSVISCDDAGGRGCETTPSASNLLITLYDGTIIRGDRFSAGLHLTPETIDLLNLQFMSRAQNAIGDYAIVIIGELPPLEQ